MEKKNIDWSNIGFGYVQTDKRYVANYKDGAWDKGALTDDPNIVMNECAGVLQYAQTCFEGLKAYTTEDGHIVTFRPDLNAERLMDSAARLEMPQLPKEQFIDAVDQVVKANAGYVPPYGSGATLYIRPYMFGINPVIVGVVVAILSAFIFLGGVGRIASVTEKIVPIMAAFYIIGALVLIIMNAGMIPEAFRQIFVGAFNPEAALGGFAGVAVSKAIQFGVARGLFSNEAGMGSTPHAHAVAKVKHPCDQGMVAMMGVFIDTLIILNLTAFSVLCTGQLTEYNQPLSAAALTQAAFNYGFGSFGSIFIAICMFFFAFSTIVGWYFFGEKNVRYLFGTKAVKPYAVLVTIFIVIGSALKVELVWNLSDLFNSLMVIPNVLGLWALSGVAKELYADWKSQKPAKVK